MNKSLRKIVSTLITPLVALGIMGLVASPASAASPEETSTAVQTILSDTNAIRSELGLPELTLNPDLEAVAMNWAQQQYLNGEMGHNPRYSTQIPSGWNAAGENVASGYTYTQVTQGWKDSPGHYANIIYNFTDIGIGYFEEDGERYYVQVFARYPKITVPGVVRDIQTTVNQKDIQVTWNAPLDNGGEASSNYDIELSSEDGVSSRTVQGQATIFEDLPYNKSYTIKVRSVNSVGKGEWVITQAVTSPTPVTSTVPDIPNVDLVQPKHNSVSFTLSGSDGGSPITSWTISIPGLPAIVSSSPQITVTGLLPSKTYGVSLYATNENGRSVSRIFNFQTTVAPIPQVSVLGVSNLTPVAGSSITLSVTSYDNSTSTITYLGKVYKFTGSGSVVVQAPATASRQNVVLKITSGIHVNKTSTKVIQVGTILKSITSKLSTTLAKTTKTVGVTGNIDIKKSGAVVDIYYSKTKTSGYKKVGTAVTDANGKYSTRVSIKTPGTYYVKVIVTNTKNFNSVSAVASSRVKIVR